MSRQLFHLTRKERNKIDREKNQAAQLKALEEKSAHAGAFLADAEIKFTEEENRFNNFEIELSSLLTDFSKSKRIQKIVHDLHVIDLNMMSLISRFIPKKDKRVTCVTTNATVIKIYTLKLKLLFIAIQAYTITKDDNLLATFFGLKKISSLSNFFASIGEKAFTLLINIDQVKNKISENYLSWIHSIARNILFLIKQNPTLEPSFYKSLASLTKGNPSFLKILVQLKAMALLQTEITWSTTSAQNSDEKSEAAAVIASPPLPAPTSPANNPASLFSSASASNSASVTVTAVPGASDSSSNQLLV